MCYAIPGKVVEVKGSTAIMDYFGEYREVFNEMDDIKPGEYAYAQGGFLVSRVDEEHAMESINLWKEAFEKLKEKDEQLSKVDSSNQIDSTKEYTKEEIIDLLKSNDPNLFKQANNVRHNALGNSCCVHAIIEFSNYCKNDCKYCGISTHNTKLKRYRMTPDEIVDAAVNAAEKLNFKALVLQSGEDDYYTAEMLEDIIRRIKQKVGVLIMISIGERDKETYQKLYDAGARAVLFRFETSNPVLYGDLHRRQSFNDRMQHLNFMEDIGYLIATGSLVGLPGQTDEDIAEDILMCKKLNAEMISIGPLIPHEYTPLSDEVSVSMEKMQKVLAVARLVMPDSKILVTSAMETLDSEARRNGLMSGANSLMINATPLEYRGNYDLYPGKTDGEVKQKINETVKLLYSLGRAPTDIGKPQ